MPTAVMTESSEKTMSRSAIWTSTDANEAATLPPPCSSSPSSRPWISCVLLPSRNRPPSDQDQVAARDLVPPEREQRRGQPDDPGEREEQEDAGAHRQQQSEAPRGRLLRRRQLPGQDGNEDDVVDAEDDLEEGERREGDQDFRTAASSFSASVSRNEARRTRRSRSTPL